MTQATSRCVESFIDGDSFPIDILPCIASFDDKTLIVALSVKVTIHSCNEDWCLRVPPIWVIDRLYPHAPNDLFVFFAVESFVEREGNVN